MQIFTAAGANGPGLGRQASPAIITNWGAAEPQQGIAADAAEGRKQNRTYIIEGTSQRIGKRTRPTSEVASYSAPCRGFG